MLYYNIIDVVDVLMRMRQVHLRSTLFITIGTFQTRVYVSTKYL